MFRKKCSRCSRKVSKNFEFCPFCGNSFGKSGDFGLLGKNDDISELDKNFNSAFNPCSNFGFGGNLFEKMLSKTMKMLENEIKQMNQEQIREKIEKSNPITRTNFQLFINGKKVNLPDNISGIRLSEKQPLASQPPKQRRIKIPEISEEILKASKSLPRKEAKSKLLRLKDRVIYELETPGIKNVNNVLINKLENSLEIKAFTDKAVFFKNLPVKLPLMQYGINPEEGKLVLEFKA